MPIKKKIKPIERLVDFIKYKNKSYRAFEKSIGLANGYISNQLIKKGDIGSNILGKILIKYPDLNITWLITGLQKMTLG